MKFAKEGWLFVLPFWFLAGLLFLLRAARLGDHGARRRLPHPPLLPRSRSAPTRGRPAYVLAPADGLITRIDTIEDPEIGPGRYQRIVTFLSVFDVHVQKVPGGGRGDRLPLRPPGARWPPSARTPATSTRSTSSVIRRPDGDLVGRAADRRPAGPPGGLLFERGGPGPPRAVDGADQVLLARRPAGARRATACW